MLQRRCSEFGVQSSIYLRTDTRSNTHGVINLAVPAADASYTRSPPVPYRYHTAAAAAPHLDAGDAVDAGHTKCPVDIKLSVRRRLPLWLDSLDIMVNPVPKRSSRVS